MTVIGKTTRYNHYAHVQAAVGGVLSIISAFAVGSLSMRLQFAQRAPESQQPPQPLVVIGARVVVSCSGGGATCIRV